MMSKAAVTSILRERVDNGAAIDSRILLGLGRRLGRLLRRSTAFELHLELAVLGERDDRGSRPVAVELEAEAGLGVALVQLDRERRLAERHAVAVAPDL